MALQRLPRRSRRRTYIGPVRVLAYTRVSTTEQADSGAGLAAQRAAIEREAQARGWQHIEWIEDAGISASTVENRPGMSAALARLAAGDADVLCVSKLDRLSRSQFDFARIVRDAQREQWSLSILDLGLDMQKPQGQMMAGVLSVFAEFERNLIAQRTRDGMAAKKAAGARFGRPMRDRYPHSIRARVARLRKKGMTYAAIANTFNAEGVPTAKGGLWYPMSIFQIAKA